MCTLRKAAIEDAYRSCQQLGASLKITSHFIDRVNVRSVNQDETFKLFTKCFHHALKNWQKLHDKSVVYKTPTETIILKVQDDRLFKKNFEIAFMTYYDNRRENDQTKSHQHADVIFRLNQV